MSKAKELVQTIRSALSDGADDLTKQRAINACDQLLVVLSAEPGQPLPVPPAPQAAAPAAPVVPPAIAPAPPVPAFSPATQMLDALIAKLRAELPKEKQPTEAPSPRDLRIPFVRTPGMGGNG
jgi:hypothetical protein